MRKVNYKLFLIQFVVMTIVGILFNPMNMLAFRLDDLYLSKTLFYGGLLMASNMIWSHEIVHYLSMGHFNKEMFIFGVILSIFIVFGILRRQILVDNKNWLRRMIPHHSTALTTTKKLLKSKDIKQNGILYRLGKDIIYNQEREISLMKLLLNN